MPEISARVDFSKPAYIHVLRLVAEGTKRLLYACSVEAKTNDECFSAVVKVFGEVEPILEPIAERFSEPRVETDELLCRMLIVLHVFYMDLLTTSCCSPNCLH